MSKNKQKERVAFEETVESTERVEGTGGSKAQQTEEDRRNSQAARPERVDLHVPETDSY